MAEMVSNDIYEAEKLAKAIEKERKKKMKNILNFFVKIANVFNNFYLFKHGYMISDDSSSSWMVRITDPECLEYIQLCFGDFKIIHIKDVKTLKKFMSEISYEQLTTGYVWDSGNAEVDEAFKAVIEKVETPSVIKKVEKILQNYVDRLNVVSEWNEFMKPYENDSKDAFIKRFFTMNNSIEYQPLDLPKSPVIILAKVCFPLLTEKNCDDMYYSTVQINGDLFNIIFYLNYDLFDIYTMLFYIPMEEK